MSTIRASLTALPWAQFKRHPTFYVWYDAFWAVGALCALLTMILTGFEGLMPEFHLWYLALLPVAAYVMIMAHVFVHNASHGNFPKAINRVVGEICGALVLTKFASWEIVHRRHHRYTDDAERDPHPAAPGYWRYAIHTLVNVERQLRQEYYDLHGDTPQTRRYEVWRSRWSFVSGVLVAVFWFALLGPGAFFMLYLPAFVGAALFVIHFNWAGHNAHRADEYEIAPADLDYGWYWLGNRLFFGIYYHGTHHKLAMLFNPMKAPEHMRAPAARRIDGSSDEIRAAA